MATFQKFFRNRKTRERVSAGTAASYNNLHHLTNPFR